MNYNCYLSYKLLQLSYFKKLVYKLLLLLSNKDVNVSSSGIQKILALISCHSMHFNQPLLSATTVQAFWRGLVFDSATGKNSISNLAKTNVASSRFGENGEPQQVEDCSSRIAKC